METGDVWEEGYVWRKYVGRQGPVDRVRQPLFRGIYATLYTKFYSRS